MSDLNDLLAVALPALIVGVIFFLAFCVLREKYPLVYAPRITFLPNTKTPQLSSGFFSWIGDLHNFDETTVVQLAGLDAAIFLRFFKIGIELFVPFLLVTSPILWGVFAVGDNDASGFGVLGMGNLEQESAKLWVAPVVGWAITLYTLHVMKRNYLEIQEMCADFNTRPQSHRYAVQVSAIPKELRSDEELGSYFKTLYPKSFHGAQISKDYTRLQELFEEWKTVRKELVQAKAEQKAKREENESEVLTKRVFAEDSALKPVEMCACCCPPCSEEVETVKYLTEKLQKLKEDILEERAKEHEVGAGGFVTFTTMADAAIASQVRHSNEAVIWRVEPAPEPRDVNWANITMEEKVRMGASTTVSALVATLVIFWTIPVAFVQSLANLEKLAELIPFLEPVLDLNAALKAFLQGFLPTLALIILMALLVPILYMLNTKAGTERNSDIERGVFGMYFFFLVFHVFLVSTLSGSLFDSLNEITDNPSSVFSLLGEALPATATFFINYVLLKAIGLFPAELLRLGPLIVGNATARFAVTEADKQLAFDPGYLDYGKFGPENLVVFVIAISYSVISPLIVPFALLFMVLGYYTWKHQLLYVYLPRYESGGRSWPMVFRFMMTGVIISQITLVGVMSLKYVYIQTVLVFPTPFVTYFFMRSMDSDYGKMIESGKLPLVVARKTDDERPAPEEVLNKLGHAFKPPCLLESVDDDAVGVRAAFDETDEKENLDMKKSSSGHYQASDAAELAPVQIERTPVLNKRHLDSEKANE